MSLLPCQQASAAVQSEYFRIHVSPGYALYGLARGTELRFSADPESLAAVPPVKATDSETGRIDGSGTWYRYDFPEVTLSVPKEHLPAGFTKLTVDLDLSRVEPSANAGYRASGVSRSANVYGRLALCRQDENEAVWTYLTWFGSETGPRPREAPVIEVLKPKPLSLNLKTKTLDRYQTGIGMQLTSGETVLQDVLKDGKSVVVKVEVFDKDDKLISSEQGDLSKFGFT